MNFYRCFFISVALVCSTASLFAQQNNGINNPMTKAVLGVYERQLKEDPNDYETYFRRANEYYRHGEYLRALSDIDNALRLTPNKESDMRFGEYMLRAGIYQQQNKHELALADLTSAVSIDPSSYVALYQKANTEFTLGRYAEARTDYTRMQRLNSRSSEALIGLARVASKENNLGMANDYLEQAVNFDPNNAEIYLRRASVRQLMGNDKGAVEDMIIAISIDAKNTKAVQTIVDYADRNYTAVMSGLSSAISQAPRVGMLWYLRATIAQAHYHYTDALNDFEKIINENLYNYPGLYASVASCQYYLGRYGDALKNIDYALNLEHNDAEYYVLRAKVLRALGNTDEAIKAAAQASTVNKDCTQALIELGLCYMDKANYSEAATLFGEATLTDTENPYYYMLRAWVLEGYLNQPVAANQFYGHILDMDTPDTNVRSLKGFAFLFKGESSKAVEWIENIMNSVTDHDGLASYYAACLYAQMDDNDKALEYVEKALKNGYANYYDWTLNNDARINVAPLRDELRFLNLLSRYNSIFGIND